MGDFFFLWTQISQFFNSAQVVLPRLLWCRSQWAVVCGFLTCWWSPMRMRCWHSLVSEVMVWASRTSAASSTITKWGCSCCRIFRYLAAPVVVIPTTCWAQRVHFFGCTDVADIEGFPALLTRQHTMWSHAAKLFYLGFLKQEKGLAAFNFCQSVHGVLVGLLTIFDYGGSFRPVAAHPQAADRA